MFQIPIKSFLVVAAIVFACVSALSAESIDFTQPAYHFIDGKPSASVSAYGYELTLFADLGVTLPGWVTPYVDATLSHSTGYGIGVNTTVLNSFNTFDPEIEGFERLRIQSFPDLLLFGFTLSQLYREGVPFFVYNEKAQYRINDGAWQTVAGNSTGSVYVPIDDPLAGVVTIDFKAASSQGLFQWNDFALASLTVAPAPHVQTPEPGTLAMLGGGLFLGALVSRRLRRAGRSTGC